MGSVRFNPADGVPRMNRATTLPLSNRFTFQIILKVTSYEDFMAFAGFRHIGGNATEIWGEAAGGGIVHGELFFSGAVDMFTGGQSAWMKLCITGEDAGGSNVTLRTYYQLFGGSFTTGGTDTTSISGAAIDLIYLAANPDFVADMEGDFCYAGIKVWDRTLTAGEVEDEFDSRTVVDDTDLVFANDCTSAASVHVDQSAVAENMTVTGSPTDETDDPWTVAVRDYFRPRSTSADYLLDAGDDDFPAELVLKRWFPSLDLVSWFDDDFPSAAGGVSQIDGTAAGTSTLSGTLTGITSLVALMAGTSGGTPTLLGTGALAGTLAGTGSMAETLMGTGALASGMAGVGAASATIVGAGAMLAALLGAGAMSETLVGVGEMAFSAAGAGALSAYLQGLAPISMLVVGSSTMSGALVGVGNLSVTAPGTSALSSTMTGTGSMAMSAAGVGGLPATLAGLTSIASSMNGSGTAAATIGGLGNVSVLLGGVGTLGAALAGSGALALIVSGASAMDATIAGWGSMGMSTAGASSQSGTAAGSTSLAAQAQGLGELFAELAGMGEASMLTSGAGSFGGVLADWSFGAAMDGTSTLEATLSGATALALEFYGVGELSAFLSGIAGGSASLAGAGNLSATLSGIAQGSVLFQGMGQLELGVFTVPEAQMSGVSAMYAAITGRTALSVTMSHSSGLSARLTNSSPTSGTDVAHTTVSVYRLLSQQLRGIEAARGWMRMYLDMASQARTPLGELPTFPNEKINRLLHHLATAWGSSDSLSKYGADEFASALTELWLSPPVVFGVDGVVTSVSGEQRLFDRMYRALTQPTRYLGLSRDVVAEEISSALHQFTRSVVTTHGKIS